LTPLTPFPYSDPMTSAVTAERIRQRLADLPGVIPDLQLLVLFGSAARDRARSESDVDLAVQCDGPADLDGLYLAMAPRLGTDRLDLIDIRRAGPLLQMAVARTGCLLFEREPGAFREFQSLASRRYCDTDKLRRARRRAIHAFLEREGLA
jgi:predicted nucleotidyltransferase